MKCYRHDPGPGPKAHAAKRRSFGIMAPASSNCILRILLRKRLSPAGARSLREARFQCFAGTYLCHVAGNTSIECKIFCCRSFSQALHNLSALDLRQYVHFGGVVPSSSYARMTSQMAITSAGGSGPSPGFGQRFGEPSRR